MNISGTCMKISFKNVNAYETYCVMYGMSFNNNNVISRASVITFVYYYTRGYVDRSFLND